MALNNSSHFKSHAQRLHEVLEPSLIDRAEEEKACRKRRAERMARGGL